MIAKLDGTGLPLARCPVLGVIGTLAFPIRSKVPPDRKEKQFDDAGAVIKIRQPRQTCPEGDRKNHQREREDENSRPAGAQGGAT
jgi:hypothetical protein